MRVTLAGLALSALLVVVPFAQARPVQSAGQLPTRGVFVPFVSLAGVQLGSLSFAVPSLFIEWAVGESRRVPVWGMGPVPA